jgi:predicted GNAT family acetyltransferase
MIDYLVEHNTTDNEFFIDLSKSDKQSQSEQKSVVPPPMNAYMRYRFVAEGQVDFYTTFVPESHRGEKLAGKLVDAGFAWAKDEGLGINASCWYAAKKL